LSSTLSIKESELSIFPGRSANDIATLRGYICLYGPPADHHCRNHDPDYPGAAARGLNASARRPVRGGAVFFLNRFFVQHRSSGARLLVAGRDPNLPSRAA